MAKYIDENGAQELVTKIRELIPSTYAGSPSAGGIANKTASIPFGTVNAGSSATMMTATVDGVTELRDGVCAMIKNGVVTSASGWTLNVNALGAKPVYQTMAESTRVTTTFNVNYTMLFVYNEDRVSGGCWDMYYGYNAGYTNNVQQGQGYATCTTAEATKAKTASLSSYALVAQGIVAVKFTHAVPAGSTLNINSKGAKAIYYRGAAITDGIIHAGDTATFIYSTYYHLIAIDKANPTKTSELTNDSGFLTSYTETDPVFTASPAYGITSTDITDWNKKADVEGYNTSQDSPTDVMGAVLFGDSVVVQHNDPTFGSLAFTGFKVASDAGIIASNVALLYNGSLVLYSLIGDVSSDTWTTNLSSIVTDVPESETDPTVPAWAKASSKPTYTASEVGALANTGGEVTGDITLKADAASNSPSLIFQRGTLTDNYNDWRIQDRGGYLYFEQRGSGSSSWSNMAMINTNGQVTASSFNGNLDWSKVTNKPTIPSAGLDTVTDWYSVSGTYDADEAPLGLIRTRTAYVTSNLPSGIGNFGFLFTVGNDTYAVQTYYDSSADGITGQYTRFKSAGTWFPWVYSAGTQTFTDANGVEY